MRKQTGTVPKATTTTPKQQTIHLATATTPLQTMGVMGQTAAASRCSPLNIVASMQQQQQQQQNQRHIHQQQHKNTEIVAPIRRELKDLNDYLLTAVTHNNNNNSNNYQQQQQYLQHPPDNTGGTNNSDLENSQENQQRFCYPVRPIPRRSRGDGEQQQSQNDLQANSLGNLSTNINAAIGVVIPTTPSVTIISSTPATLPTLTSAITTGPTNSKTNNHQSSAQAFNWNQQLHNKLLLLQLQQIQQLFKEPAQANALLNLTNLAATNFIPTSVLNHNANELQNLLQLNSNQQRNNSNSLTNISSNRLSKSLKASDMVHEANPNSSQREIVVNSTSLEDVASSDRAQSINSLHSNCETPTPTDQSPTLEELQDRLVTSTRNIMNMQEQTEQLKRLQSTAKQHLNEMEKMRQQSNTNESNILDKICNGNDLDQSVEQIHSDMSLLVNRMKYLTTFIQHQNELSAQLGDDGPESQAEQEALQRKLEDLRLQRDEMRQLVSELQDVNRTAEESAKEVRQRQLEQEKDVVEMEPVAATVKTSPTARAVYNSERVVPIEYTRTLPIELIQELVPHTARLQEDEQACLSAEALQQRESDIEAMKAQLKRLKEMMETVNMIESHTSRDPKLIEQEINRERSAALTMPVEGKSVVKNSPDTVEDISRKVRILDEVTTDLRVQAESLQAERNRIEALKAEIERRKQQAAAAAQLGEEALKRSSLTPTPATKVAERNITKEDADRQQAQEDRERLKSEYDVKKKEFEILCQRLDQEEATDHTQTPSTRQEIVSEADDEAEDICDSDYLGSGNNNNNISTTNNNNKFSARASTPVVCGRGLLREVTDSASLRQNLAKDSINSSGAVLSSNVTQVNQAGNSSQDGASLEGASLLSGSCRSFSMPLPMTEMGLNFPGPLPPPLPTAWNAQQYYYSIPISVPPPLPVPASTSNFNIKEPSTMPPSSGECICNGNNLGAATSSSTTSATTNMQLASDPMLQQFIHTQQMLINSVCQCNQMLWHQQREIDSLNHTIRTLQDRILALTAGHQVASTTGAVTFNSADIDYNIRSESVPLPPPPPPPPTLTAVNMSNIPSSGHTSAILPNNLYMSSHRAHSEQPIAFGSGPRRMAPESYHNYPEQQKHHQQQEQQQQQQYVHLYHHNRRDYNFCSESQQYNASATNNQTNNQSVVNGQTPTTSALHYNNEIPNSSRQHSSPPPPPPPLVNASPVAPAPIFMHHHNNSIHQNNANLRTQNQQQHRSNINNLTTAAGGNTLNNQVPPGNRANNYWDNFRSYSRQNLLSTNSNKSNEEQQQQQQQDNEYATTRMTNGLMHRHQAPAPPSLASHTRMLCQQQQQQHLDEISNNLNFDNNNMNSGYNKYLRVMQRSRINQQQQRQYQQQSSYQQQQQQQQSDSSQHLSWLQQQQHHQQQQQPQQHIINTNDGSNNIAAAATTTTTTAATMYHNYNNINQGNKVSAKQISQLRNRNEDFNVPAIATTAEQLRQATITNERYHNAGERDDSYFLNSPLNQRQQQDADYMLRPFQGMDDNTYDFNNCNEQLQQHHSYITMEVSNNSTNTHKRRENKNNDNNEDDDDDDDDEEDTTTSEEIKRNLLVNALKNDKFTTKFYESIKEDVFRRLESMLLDKNNRSTVVASCSNSGNTGQQFLNNITNANNTRKMYLNEERRLHKQESGQQPKMETSNINSINDDYDYQLSVGTAAGEDNSTLVAVVEVDHDENEKPEEDCNDWCDDTVTSLNNCSPRAVSTVTNVSATNANLRCSVHGITKNVTKKRKNQRKQDTNYNNNNTNSCNNNIGVITKSQQQQQQNETLNENLRGACSLAAQEHQQQKQKQNEDQLNEEKVGEEKNLICSSSSTPSTSTASSTPTNYSNAIITSIITKLRHHLHQDNNHINDARLSEIAKLTASVAQSSYFNNNGYNISAKRIYAKMKKLSFPRKRDEFLHWYQNYLQTNLFLMNNNAITGGGSKTNNNNNDDRDLAEADQNCSTANQQNANYTQNEARDHCKDKLKLVAAEFENQEIPDVENHNKKDSEGACALLVSQQPPQSLEIVKDFKIEKESNEQKINTDVNASLNDDN